MCHHGQGTHSYKVYESSGISIGTITSKGMAKGGSVASKNLNPAIFRPMDTDKVGCFADIGAHMPGVHSQLFKPEFCVRAENAIQKSIRAHAVLLYHPELLRT